MSKRERDESGKDRNEKKLKEDPESVVVRALKVARKILCEEAQAIIDAEGVVSVQAEDWSNLFLGAFLGYVDMVKLLIQNGADVNAVEEKKNDGITYRSSEWTS